MICRDRLNGMIIGDGKNIRNEQNKEIWYNEVDHEKHKSIIAGYHSIHYGMFLCFLQPRYIRNERWYNYRVMDLLSG